MKRGLQSLHFLCGFYLTASFLCEGKYQGEHTLATVNGLRPASIYMKIMTPDGTFLLVVHRLCVSSVCSISGPVRQKDHYRYSIRGLRSKHMIIIALISVLAFSRG